MHNAYIITGTLTDSHTLRLDEPLPLTRVRVRVVVEPLAPAASRSAGELIAEIHSAQTLRGHKAPSRDEVDE